MSNKARISKGTPTGGEFKAVVNREATSSLPDSADDLNEDGLCARCGDPNTSRGDLCGSCDDEERDEEDEAVCIKCGSDDLNWGELCTSCAAEMVDEEEASERAIGGEPPQPTISRNEQAPLLSNLGWEMQKGFPAVRQEAIAAHKTGSSEADDPDFYYGYLQMLESTEMFGGDHYMDVRVNDGPTRALGTYGTSMAKDLLESTASHISYVPDSAEFVEIEPGWFRMSW